MTDEPQLTQIVEGGYWDGDGKFHSPEGWPEGAGWCILNADGSVADWGPATDLHMVLYTDAGNTKLPPAADLGVAWVGTPADEPTEGLDSD